MKIETLKNWSKDFRHDGLLFFTQRINEMLFHQTDHIFKAPVLNTYLLADEYIKTAKLVKKGLINENHSKQIMEEFQDTFIKDIIIKEHLDENERNRILHKLNGITFDEQIKMMEYVQYILRDYNEWCKQYIKEIVPKEKEKKKIESALKCYIPGLLAAGYSHEFIYSYNIEIFSKKAVTSLKALDVFINRFDFKDIDFIIYIAIIKEAIVFKKVLEQGLNVDFGPFKDEKDMDYDNTQYILIRIQVKAVDEQSAAWRAYNRLNIFFLYYCYFSEKKDSWFFAKAKVIDKSHKVAIVNLKDNGLVYSPSKLRDQLAQYSNQIIFILQSKARESYFQINRAMMTHNIAIEDLDIRNKFLNLWSTLEIVFVSDQSDSKISEILKKAVPIIINDYLSYLFTSLEINIKEVVNKKLLSQIIERFDKSEQKNGIIYIIALNEYNEERKNLYKLLCNYPLIRSRISQLNELCNDKKQFQNCINTFEQRIKWHITRLYRTRNAIIHSGEQPNYLRELVEHLHSYSDQCLFELIGLLSLRPELETISNVIIDVQFRKENIGERLKGKDSISKEDVDYILNKQYK